MMQTSYFTGAQSQILIGDKVIGEVTEIEGQYSVNQIPLYGYASHHFNTVASGRVIAMGSLAINYVFDGYLFAFLENDTAQKANSTVEKQDSNNTLQTPKSDIKLEGKEQYFQPVKGEDPSYIEIFTPTDKVIDAYKKAYWEKEQQDKTFTDSIRPEFSKGPFNIKMRDFRIGSLNPESSDQKTLYEEKIFIDVYLNNYGTIRKTDDGVTQEIYRFIAKAFI